MYRFRKIVEFICDIFLLTWFAKNIVRLSSYLLSPYSYIIIYRKSGWEGVKKHRYEIARGHDILANKMHAPALDKHFSIKQLSPYGQDETISENMARNKFVVHDNSSTADWWETKVIDKFEANHLLITLAKNNQMTKEEIITVVTNIVTSTTSAGQSYALTEVQLDEVTDAVAEGLSTVNPTKEYPPVKL